MIFQNSTYNRKRMKNIRTIHQKSEQYIQQEAKSMARTFVQVLYIWTWPVSLLCLLALMAQHARPHETLPPLLDFRVKISFVLRYIDLKLCFIDSRRSFRCKYWAYKFQKLKNSCASPQQLPYHCATFVPFRADAFKIIIYCRGDSKVYCHLEDDFDLFEKLFMKFQLLIFILNSKFTSKSFCKIICDAFYV